MNAMNRGVRCYHRWLAPTLKALKNKKDSLPVRAPDPRKSFVEWNYEAELYAFSKRLGEHFNKDLLKNALTDKRYVELEEKKRREVGVEPEIALTSNDTLVAEGNNLIENYVLRYLAIALPKLPEIYILKIKDYLTSEDMLAHISKNIGIDDILLIDEAFPGPSSLCRGFKAVVCAVEDVQRAECLIRDLVISQLCGFDLTKVTTPEKPIEELKEYFLLTNRSPPEFRLIAESGVNTLLPVYHVGVYCDKTFVGRGFGESVSIAKDMAACDVLWRLWGIQRRKPFFSDLAGVSRKSSSLSY